MAAAAAFERKEALKGEDTRAYVRAGGDRECTDLYCCCIFVLFWISMWVMVAFAIEYGNVDRLVRPRDMNRHSCGMETGDVDLTIFPRLYFPNPTDDSQQICVKECPGATKGSCRGALMDSSGSPVMYGELPPSTTRARLWQTTMSSIDTAGPGVIPWYSSEEDCAHHGDCSALGNDISLHDVAADECTRLGICRNGTVATTNPDYLDGMSPLLFTSSQEPLCDHTFEPLVWTSYRWAIPPQPDEDLFVCTPKEGCMDPSCASDSYPPSNFLEAQLNGFISQRGPCWMPVLSTEEYLLRCIPDIVTDASSDLRTSGAIESAQYMQEMKDYWPLIPVGAGVAFVASFMWIFLIGKIVYWLVVGTVSMVLVVLPFISLKCFYNMGVVVTKSCDALSDAPIVNSTSEVEFCTLTDLHSVNAWGSVTIDGLTDEEFVASYDYNGRPYPNCAAVGDCVVPCTCTGFDLPPELRQAVDKIYTSQALLPYIGYGSLIAWVALGLIACVYYDRILISIGVIEEATDAILDIPSTAFLPVVVLLSSLPVSAFACVACVLLLSLRRVTEDGSLQFCLTEVGIPEQMSQWEDGRCESGKLTTLHGMFFSQVFAWIWIVQWFVSLQFCSVAGAISKWYFTPSEKVGGEKKITPGMLGRSVMRTLRHHSGTAAFGAFVITVVICVKHVLLYLLQQAQSQAHSKIVKMIIRCLQCLVTCVAEFIKFVGHLVYVETSIYGTNFCTSLAKATSLLVRNAVRFSFLTAFAKLVLVLGRFLMVVTAVYVASWLVPLCYVGDPDAISNDEHQPILPLFMVGVFSLTIGNVVFGVYETAIDTIMVSFLEDEKYNKDTGIYASGELQKFMKGAKTITDAIEDYKNAVREAKETEAKLIEKVKETELLNNTSEVKKKRKEHRSEQKHARKEQRSKLNKEKRKAQNKQAQEEFMSNSPGVLGKGDEETAELKQKRQADQAKIKQERQERLRQTGGWCGGGDVAADDSAEFEEDESAGFQNPVLGEVEE